MTLTNAVIGFTLVVVGVALAGLLGYYFGEKEGRFSANASLWETPPHMAYCVVYKDGGKRCTPYAELERKIRQGVRKTQNQ